MEQVSDVICPLFGFHIINMVTYPADPVSQVQANKKLNEQQEQIERGFSFDGQLILRPIAHEDIESIKKSLIFSLFSLFDPQLPNLQLSSLLFVLSTSIYTLGEPQKANETIDNGVLALKLYQSGYFLAKYHFPIPHSTTLSKPPVDRGSNVWMGLAGRYDICVDEIPNVRLIFERVQKSSFRKSESFRLAVERFLHGYEEVEMENRLIDYIVALEALLLEGGKTKEKKKHLALKCARIAGGSQDEEKEIQRIITGSYEIRNSIIHGSKYERFKTDKETCRSVDVLQDIVPKLEYYLRKSIINSI